MRVVAHLLAIALCLGLAVPAVAQEAPPPVKEEPAKPAAPVAETPAKEAPPAPAAKAAPEAPAEHSFCAKALVPLAESYKKAYDDLQKWIAEIDSKYAAVADKVLGIQKQIQANETAITKAKLDGDGTKEKELTKANKQLWTDLEDAKKNQSEACGDLCKQASKRVEQYSNDIESKLDQCKAQLK
jgi:hypothetical protein